jgi:hypothetical protein
MDSSDAAETKPLVEATPLAAAEASTLDGGASPRLMAKPQAGMKLAPMGEKIPASVST